MTSEYCYHLRVLVTHPTLRVDALSKLIGEEPDYAEDVGVRNLEQSFWSRVSTTKGDRRFFSEVADVVEWLAGKPNLVPGIRAAGGRVEVIVHLHGAKNIGDTIQPELLARAGNLGIALGVEVFPNMNECSEI